MRSLTILFLFFTNYIVASNITFSSFETSNHQLTLQEISAMSFNKLENNSISRGFNFHTIWIKLQFNTAKSEDRILYLDNPTLDTIDFYKNTTLISSTGDHRVDPIKQDIAFSFPITVDNKNTYYLKIQTKNGLFTNFKVSKLSEHLQKSNYEKMFFTFFFGFLLSLILYNIFLFISLKERVYFYYISFQISIFMLLLSYSGLGYFLFWQGNYQLNEFVYQRFEILALFFALIFAQTFLHIKEYSSKLNLLINITLLLLLYIVFTSWTYHSFIFQFVLIQTVLLGFIMIIYSIKRKIQNATIFFLATFFILFATLITFLKIFGFLESNFLTTWSIYIGSMLESILFSIALANQINALKKREKFLLNEQKDLLTKEVKRQTKSLKRMVQDKEILLKEINHRVKNNLQIISSFVSFASMYSKEKQILQNLNQRISAISLLYNSLYKPNSHTHVNMKIYIEHICKEIFIIYTPKVKLNININHINFDFDKAITIGLIVNEIITNMITHAFKNTKEATIELSINKELNHYILKIEDNGIGFDINKNYESLGLKLIKRLSEKQLRGQLQLESNHQGSSFTIIFK